ncbi:MAG TPA: tetratricopeptide repeat protein [Candidatus Acidoferrum sp.]|nr:tetratricopeptide repeat protein [Candidatus Acidoferrum sp.]
MSKAIFWLSQPGSNCIERENFIMTAHTLRRHLSTLLTLALAVALSSGCTKAAKRSRYLARADRDFRAEQYDRAEIEYMAVFKVAPLDPVAISQLGLLYFTDGMFPQAQQFLKKAVELQPENLELRTKLAMADFAVQRLGDARAQALQVLAKQPANPDALLVLADTTTTTNQLKESTQKLDALPASAKSSVAYHLARGTLWLKQQSFTNAEAEYKQAVTQDPKSSLAHLALGNFYAVRNDARQAEASFKTAAELSPPRSNARIRYADFRYRTGAREEARKAVTQITQQAPDYIPAWNFLVQAAYTEGKGEECAALIQKVLARDPINREALLTSGDLLLTHGDGTNALARFERVAALYGRRPDVLYKLALASLVNHDLTKALANLNQAVTAATNYLDAIMLLATVNIRRGEPAQAASSLSQFVKREPQFLEPRLLLAKAYLAQGDYDSAAEVYRSTQTLFPSNPQVAVLLAAVLAQQNKRPEARQEFAKALDRSPDYLPAIEGLVELDILDQRYAAALERVQKLAAKNASAPEPLLLMARVLTGRARAAVGEENAKNARSGRPMVSIAQVPAAQADIKQAEAELHKAIELKPDLPAAYLALSEIHVALGQPQQALATLNGFLARTNDGAVLLQVAMLNDSLTNYAAARDAYEKVLALDPNLSGALNNLAYLYSERLVDLDKALPLAEKARQLQPHDPAAADTLGWILYKRGDYPRALSLIQEAAAGLPNLAEVQFHLGMAYYALAEEAAARAALEKASKAKEDFPSKREAQARLAILAIDPRTASAATVAQLEQHLRQVPGDPIALSRLAAIQERDGALDKALETYQSALKYNPQSARLMVRLAQIYSSGRYHDPQKALEWAKKAHNLAPDDAAISAMLGRLAFETADYKWAANLLEDSARKLPNDPEVSYDLAWTYYALGRVPDAEAAMKGVAAAPGSKSEEARRFVGMVAAAKGPAVSASAAAQAEAILKAEPNYVPALMVSGLAQEKAGNYKQAAHSYEKALADFPLFAPATRNLAILCFERLGDDTRAYDLASKARQTFRDDPRLARTLGILSYRKQDYQKAAQFLKEAAQSQAGDGEVLFCLGLAQYQLKARSECKTSLQKALALNSLEPKKADEARRVLAELK